MASFQEGDGRKQTAVARGDLTRRRKRYSAICRFLVDQARFPDLPVYSAGMGLMGRKIGAGMEKKVDEIEPRVAESPGQGGIGIGIDHCRGAVSRRYRQVPFARRGLVCVCIDVSTVYTYVQYNY